MVLDWGAWAEITVPKEHPECHFTTPDQPISGHPPPGDQSWVQEAYEHDQSIFNHSTTRRLSWGLL